MHAYVYIRSFYKVFENYLLRDESGFFRILT